MTSISADSPAREYRPRQPLVAAKVAKPYVRVAAWCDGEVIRRHSMKSTVVGIAFTGAYGESLMAYVGDYIAIDPVTNSFIKIPGEAFEKEFIENRALS